MTAKPNLPGAARSKYIRVLGSKPRESSVSDPENGLREDVTISVERMMRFCYLAQMQFEYAPGAKKALPLHLTRFGTLVLETASFLYSLFEDRQDAINLLKSGGALTIRSAMSCRTV